jgi:plastocyanin
MKRSVTRAHSSPRPAPAALAAPASFGALVLLAAFAWASAAPRDAGAGVISGVVRVPATGRTAEYSTNAYPGRASSLALRSDPSRGLVSDAVVSIASLPASAESTLARDPSEHVLAQKNQAFSARVLPCVVGSTIDFPNLDPIYHNVFSVSPVKRFDLGKYPRGHSKKVRFTKPGIIPVFCDIHSNMASTIVVLPNRAFAKPDATGAFTLPALPAGTYVVKLWHPDFGESQTSVKVPAHGDVAVELEF